MELSWIKLVGFGSKCPNQLGLFHFDPLYSKVLCTKTENLHRHFKWKNI